MEKIRVHQLAKELGRQNKEIIEYLKAKGQEVSSHMSNIDESTARMVRNKFSSHGKESSINLDRPNTDEKVTASKAEGTQQEAPKKKKNIIRVYHAQNASGTAKKKPAQKRPANGTAPTRPARPKTEGAPAQSAVKATAQPVKPAETKPAAQPVKTTETKTAAQPVKTAETKPAAQPVKPAETKTTAQPAKPAETKPAVQPAKAPETKVETKPVKSAETKPAERTEASQNRNNTPSERRFNNDRSDRQNRGEGRGDNRGQRQYDSNRQPRQFNGEGRRDNRQENRGPRQYDPNRQSRQFNGEGRGDNRGQRQYDPNRQPRQFNGEGRGDNRGQRQYDPNRQPRQFNGEGRGDNRGQRQYDPNRQPRQFNGEGRSDGRFSGNGQGRQNVKPAQKRGGADAAFAPELTKTSKDSKRERDRENKNKKNKDFEKTNQGRRPNQNGKRPMNRIPKALQNPAPKPKQEEKKPEIKEIVLPEKMTIGELAQAMKMQPSVIVKKLFLEGMMVTVNHEIDFEKAQEIALDYDIVAELEEKVDVIEELLKEEDEDEDAMVSRPPVVCVMGHVDHGKTSLLDAIRKTNVTRGEAGGITQHIGASVVSIDGQDITFLDTPGHEAFTAMRMRGANSTDIAVLVVAADDGIMPQTVEAISHAKAAGVEIIVAVNKIDKEAANIDRVKQELTEYELIPEDWGGSTVVVPVSAHTGEGIENLLEMILLTAEVLELKANPNRAARGLVIEAKLDKGKGPVATILVQKGTLHVGDFIAAGSCSGKVRAMMDDKGRRVKTAGPSTPVEILGLGDVPNAGEVLMSFDTDKDAKNFAAAFVTENKSRLLEETKSKLSLDNLFDQIHAIDLKELPIIVKADVQGSVEAVKQSLTKLSNEEVVVKVIHGGVGAINESDVTLASTSNAIIIGFNVNPDIMAKQLAEQEQVDMRLYKVIYQAIEDIERAMKGMLDPIFEEKVIGHAEVRQLFKASGIGTIAGSYILDGIFQRNCKVRITREGDQIFEGELASLKRFKDDVKEVKAGYECGLVFDGFNDLKEEDKVEAYIMVEVPR